MNVQEGNKLKFQLLTILRQNVGNLVIIGMFSFCLALISIQDLHELKYGHSGYRIHDLFWLLAIFASTNTALTSNYNDTAAYFLNLGYTRKKYYKSNMIFSFIISCMTSIAILLVYIIGILNDKLYKLNGIITYMGFSFEGFTAYSYVKIVLITFIIITFICALANFVSIISFSSKALRITIRLVVFALLFLVIFAEGFTIKFTKFISYINGDLALALIFYIAGTIILYILANKVFMYTDVD